MVSGKKCLITKYRKSISTTLFYFVSFPRSMLNEVHKDLIFMGTTTS